MLEVLYDSVPLFDANINSQQPLTGCSDVPGPEAEVPCDVWLVLRRPVNAPEQEVGEQRRFVRQEGALGEKPRGADSQPAPSQGDIPMFRQLDKRAYEKE